MKLNDTFEYQFTFTQHDVDNFAAVTGDFNPIHVDEAEAAKSIFKKRIMHGFLSGSVFSKVFGTMWPGNGTIYLSQNMKFLQPMHVDRVYKACFVVVEVLPKNKYVINTSVKTETNENAVDGQAIVKHD